VHGVRAAHAREPSVGAAHRRRATPGMGASGAVVAGQGRGTRRGGLRAGRGKGKRERREERGSSPRGSTIGDNRSPGSNLGQGGVERGGREGGCCSRKKE
jgi:hypothetical protein